jgi:catechol 2,3-dioxygenase-like lactoylglutathione lyase family enzyme
MTGRPPQLTHLLAFRLTASDPQRLTAFYTNGIGCAVGDVAPIPASEMASLGLAGGGVRRSLSFGDERIDLDMFEHPGAEYPMEANAADLVFQHFALVVTDAAEAYRRALDHGAIPISESGPIRLPASAGSVTAVKFRDPEGHPLEFLQFPPGGGGRWNKAPAQQGPLGVDHSAISVADADASALFYSNLGLHESDRTLNRGETQVALDGLQDVQVDVAPLYPEHPAPHLELLGYRVPRGRPAPKLKANDIAASRIVWASDQEGLFTDPDGHLHQMERGG